MREPGLRLAGTVGPRETEKVENSMGGGDAIGFYMPVGGRCVSGLRAGFGGE